MAGKVKKIFRDKFGVIGEAEREALKSELGDVLWYIAQVCTELEISLDEVAERNIAKLSDRLERGKIGGDGSFGILAPVGVYNYLDLAGIPGEYLCSTRCWQSCLTATSVVSPSVGKNFFLTAKRAAWWQTAGGGCVCGVAGRRNGWRV